MNARDAASRAGPTADLDDPSRYARSFADVYDRWYGDIDDVDAVVDTLGRNATGRRLVELGAGTGRLAIPLAAAGAEVIALDVAPAMISTLTAKIGDNAGTLSGGDNAGTLAGIVADMTTLPMADASVDTALIAYNTLFSLPSPQAQHRAMAECARVVDGGRVVIDCIVPSASPSRIEHRVAAARHDETEAVLIATKRNPSTSTIVGAHLHFDASGFHARPWLISPIAPQQLDLMATAVGLTLHDEWSDWAMNPYDGGARRIATYRPHRM